MEYIQKEIINRIMIREKRWNNNGYEMTIHPKNHLFYLKKKFSQQFQNEIDITLSDDHLGEIIVKEKENGKKRQRYASKKLWERLVKIVHDKEKMRFIFFRDEEKNIWRGILLPGFHQSILWEDFPERREGSMKKSQISDSSIIYHIKWKYRLWMEQEELENIYLLGLQIAKKNYSYIDDRNFVVSVCSGALAEEYVRIQRRCKRAESMLSLDMPIHNTSENSVVVFFGRNDSNFENIEVRDFVSRLTPQEKRILRILLDHDQLSHFVGTQMEEVIAEGREALKKKAYDYYGKEYLRKYEDKGL